MNKKSFLDKLKKSLSILKEEEREDILNEYKDIIEEKVKHGQTEEEAVKEFGDYKELVKGILDAYKINTEEEKTDSSTKDKAKEILNTGEELIKEGAKKLTEATDKLVTEIKENHTEITLEFVFEIILKALCVLVIMALLTIPFSFLSHLGGGLLDFAFFPLNHVLRVLWKILIGILYLVSFAFLAYAIFKEYIDKKEVSTVKKTTSTKKKDTVSKVEKEKVQEKETVNEKKTVQMEERVSPKVVSPSKGGDTVSNLLLILLKIFIIFVFLIPIWCVIIAFAVLLSITIFFLIKGVGIIGILFGIIGIIGFLAQLSNLLYNGLFHQKKMHLYPFLISIVFMIVGSIMTIDFITDIDYIRDTPSQYLKQQESVYTYSISKKTKIDLETHQYHYETDASLEDGKVVLKIKYNEDFSKPSVHTYEAHDTYYIDLNAHAYFSSKKSFEFFVENLKKNKVYEHRALSNYEVTILTNENTKSYIEID